MNDKKSGSNHHTRAPNTNKGQARNDSAEYGERQGTKVTNTFSPPTRPGKGENNGDKSDK